MALHTDTQIYKATYELSKLITKFVATMPRNYRADFGADLRRACFDLVRRVYQANATKNRLSILAQLREEIEAVNLSIRLAKDLRLISVPQYAQLIALTDSIGKQATGWYQYSERALVAGSSRRSGQRAI